MGNTMITSLCRREEVVDFEDISDATFDFISVAVHKDAIECSGGSIKTKTSTKTNTLAPPRSPACDSMNKIVAVVPVALEPSLSSRTIVGYSAAAEESCEMSFNDRLNMLTWDPETTPLPTPFQHHEMYVFDEYAPRPTNNTTSLKTKRSSDGWIRRAVDTYQETKTRRREARQMRRQRVHDQHARATTPKQHTTKKRSLQMTLWGKRKPTTEPKDQPYQLPLMTSMSSMLDDDDEAQRFLFDQDEDEVDHMPVTPTAQDIQTLLKTKKLSDEDPISDTESDDSGSDATTLCRFYARFDEDAASTSSDYLDDDSESDFSDWTRSTSTSSCYFSAAEDDARSATDCGGSDIHGQPEHDEEDAACSVPRDATLGGSLTDYLCECGDCPSYMAIERDVTNSNSWMNESERRALCRVLQAYSTFNSKAAFHKDMIASAEECLLVFQGDEQAAFTAFAMLAQSKW